MRSSCNIATLPFGLFIYYSSICFQDQTRDWKFWSDTSFRIQKRCVFLHAPRTSEKLAVRCETMVTQQTPFSPLAVCICENVFLDSPPLQTDDDTNK